MQRTDHGRRLSRERGLGSVYSLYHVDGHWYQHPRYFPCAFHDPHGYLFVRDEEHWRELQERGFLVSGIKTNVPRSRFPRGIKDIPGYVWVRPIDDHLTGVAA